MELGKALKFVQGSIAKKELQEGLTHFKISGGVVKGFNGTIALCSPIGLDIECTPKADPMIRAINNCEETVQMTMMANGKLNVKSGGFRVNIDCIDIPTPHVDPEGDIYEINGKELLEAISAIQPFISSDASRPWSCGVLLDSGSAFATNNVTIVQYWFGSVWPIRCAVPRMAVKELLRIKETPTHIQVTTTSITFHYESGCWMRSQLLDMSGADVRWPDMGRILDRSCGTNAYPVAPDLFDALEKIKPFCDGMGKVFMENGLVRTHYTDGEGAAQTFSDFKSHGVYHVDLLLLLKGVAKTYDFNVYTTDTEDKRIPPAYFYGDNLRGLIAGMRL